MFQPHQMHAEIEYRHKKTHAEYIRAQRQVSIAGLRQIVGNTIIELGDRIHGVAQSSCQDAASAGAQVRTVIRTPDPTIKVATSK